jgi:hypothetical protein
VVGVSRDIAPGGAVDRDPRIDFVEITVAAPLAPKSLLGTDAGPFVFGDFFALSEGPERE